jgi:hypothetical protein
MSGVAIDDRPPGRLKRNLAIAGWLLSGAAVLCLTWWTEPLWRWERHVLPSTIEIDAVLASGSRGGFMAGCEAAVYRLSDATLAHLKTEGIAYLDHAPRPQNDKRRNAYQKWRETPGEIDVAQNGRGPKPAVPGLYAAGGCGEDFDPAFKSDEVEKALSIPGSYYTVTKNREGIIVIIPERKLAAFYYYG